MKNYERSAKSAAMFKNVYILAGVALLCERLFNPCNGWFSSEDNPTAQCTRPKSNMTPKALDQLLDPKKCTALLKEKPMLYQELQVEYLKAEKQAKKMSQNKNTKPTQNKNNPTGSIDSGSADTESAQQPAEATASGI
jgi:hypothetical protein